MKEEIVYVPLCAVGQVLKLEQMLKAIQMDSSRLIVKSLSGAIRNTADGGNGIELGLLDHLVCLGKKIDEAVAFSHQIVLDEALGGAELERRGNAPMH